MAIHKSLKSRDVLKRQRNVLNRWERIQTLREQENWEEGRTVFSLPKVKVRAQRKRVKVKKEAVEETASAEGVEAPTEGKPQTGPA